MLRRPVRDVVNKNITEPQAAHLEGDLGLFCAFFVENYEIFVELGWFCAFFVENCSIFRDVDE